MNIRINIGVTVNTHKIVRRPAVGGVYPGSQAGGIVGAQDFIRRIAAEPHLEARIGTQQIGKIDADLIGNILFDQVVPNCAGVVAGWIVSLINKNFDGQIVHPLTSLFTAAANGSKAGILVQLRHTVAVVMKMKKQSIKPYLIAIGSTLAAGMLAGL